MKHRTLICAASVVLLLPSFLHASTARAAQAEGRRLFREGVQLIEREQREAACERFERANAYIVRDNNLWNIAICHVNFGRRDLALAALEVYLQHSPRARASRDVQNLLWQFEGEPPIIMDTETTREWGNRLTAAVEAADSRRGDTVPPEQQTYGAGTDSPGAPMRREVVRRHGTQLFQEGLVRARVGDWEGARALWERSLTYRQVRNAAYNIGEVHLGYGRRDLALHFYGMYLDSLPAIADDPGVRSALEAIENAPSDIRTQETRDRLASRFSQAVTAALEGRGGPTATPTEGEQQPQQ
jgi:tetratricopeptide (TPR) repeat protein